ncbi:hypothetical protein Tsubulata_021069 [Turnera subulata]|uniref:DUF7722 domain-containing protein n=1 Tax=Turnera subulata TaxID=218843 RepID=A0A9Q0FV60_9ROSI|nr:hypothetical protein Tsubulata_021069 [Turnera subulata]
MAVSALTVLFHDECTDKANCMDSNKAQGEHTEKKASKENSSCTTTATKCGASEEKFSCSQFQMPLHYPGYTKKHYEVMDEWELNLLLVDYGLQGYTHHDLAYKRNLAMGTFLWNQNDTVQDSPAPPQGKEVSVVLFFLLGLLGFA